MVTGLLRRTTRLRARLARGATSSQSAPRSVHEKPVGEESRTDAGTDPWHSRRPPTCASGQTERRRDRRDRPPSRGSSRSPRGRTRPGLAFRRVRAGGRKGPPGGEEDPRGTRDPPRASPGAHPEWANPTPGADQVCFSERRRDGATVRGEMDARACTRGMHAPFTLLQLSLKDHLLSVYSSSRGQGGPAPEDLIRVTPEHQKPGPLPSLRSGGVNLHLTDS